MIDVMGEALIDLMEIEDGTFRAVPGGSPANVALGLARLETECRFLGRFSDDRFGRLSRKRLADAGVDLSAAVSTSLLSTVAVVSMNPDASARYGFYVAETADWAWRHDELPEDSPEAFHTGSLAAALLPGRTVVDDHMHRLRATGECLISYDPNIRPSLAGDHDDEVARVEEQARTAHLVKLSIEDLRWLYPGATDAEPFRRAGIDADIVLTLGADGARLYRHDGDRVQVPPVSVSVVDTVGAGDAFSAAILAALKRRNRLRPNGPNVAVTTPEWNDILAFANRVAALTCERAGADPPHRDLLDRGLLVGRLQVAQFHRDDRRQRVGYLCADVLGGGPVNRFGVLREHGTAVPHRVGAIRERPHQEGQLGDAQ